MHRDLPEVMLASNAAHWSELSARAAQFVKLGGKRLTVTCLVCFCCYCGEASGFEKSISKISGSRVKTR